MPLNPNRSRRLFALFFAGLLLGPNVRAREQLDWFYYGDARIRLYAADPQPAASSNTDEPPLTGDTRLRATLQLNLTDSLSASITPQWETRLYSREHADAGDARFGQYAWQDDQFNLGKSELRWNHIAFMPVSWSLGRTVLSYDDGLLFSDTDDAWLLDASTLSIDSWPCTLDLTWAEVSHLAPETDLREFLFLHASREADRLSLRRQTIYLGAFRMRDDGEPILAGLRSTLFENKAWRAILELAGETGTRPGEAHLLAGIADAALTRTWRGGKGNTASLSARTTWASGDQQPGGAHAFIPIMNYEDWGCVFSPSLSNIRIHTLTARYIWRERWTFEGRLYHYEQMHPAIGPASTGNFNNGGYEISANGEDAELGTEIDLRAACLMNDRLSLELLAGHFFRGAAYAGIDQNNNASEIRLQLIIPF
ncbi:MAG: alginate export family protein [Kiritimatiellae bacterium]|nr:alginate export family protein [Kiritimatiellia bacterium]